MNLPTYRTVRSTTDTYVCTDMRQRSKGRRFRVIIWIHSITLTVYSTTSIAEVKRRQNFRTKRFYQIPQV